MAWRRAARGRAPLSANPQKVQLSLLCSLWAMWPPWRFRLQRLVLTPLRLSRPRLLTPLRLLSRPRPCVSGGRKPLLCPGLGCSKCRRSHMGCRACKAKMGWFEETPGQWTHRESKRDHHHHHAPSQSSFLSSSCCRPLSQPIPVAIIIPVTFMLPSFFSADSRHQHCSCHLPQSRHSVLSISVIIPRFVLFCSPPCQCRLPSAFWLRA